MIEIYKPFIEYKEIPGLKELARLQLEKEKNGMSPAAIIIKLLKEIDQLNRYINYLQGKASAGI